MSPRITRTAGRLRIGWHTAYGHNPFTLALIAVTSVWRGVNYIREGIPRGSLPPIESISGFISVRLWAVLWILAGTAMLTGLLWRRVFAAGASCAAVLWALWGLAFLWVATTAGENVSTSAGVTGAGFLAVGVAAWSLASDETDYDDWQETGTCQTS